MQTEEINQNPGATEIFRMPAADATVPDLMAQQKPANPTLTIVKGPQVGQTFELDQAEYRPLAATQRTASSSTT